MPKGGWLDRLIGGGKTAISTINVGLSYNIIFVVCILTPSLCIWDKLQYWASAWARELIILRYLHWASEGLREICSKSGCKDWHRSRALSSCWIRSCSSAWSRVRASSYWRDRARDRRASCRDFNRPLSGACHDLVPSSQLWEFQCLWDHLTCTILCRSFYRRQSHEIMLFMVRSTVDSIFTQKNAPLSTICALLELSSFKADLSRKPVLPPPSWLRHDTSVLISTTTTMARLRAEIFTQRGRVFPNPKGMMGTSSCFPWFILVVYFYCLF